MPSVQFLLQGYHLLKYKADRHLLVPLLVTASLEDRALASMYLQKEAFDLIVKPLIAQEAAQSVKLALWQSALLKLLASKERATARFREHMETFPYALKAIAQLENNWAAFEQTIRTNLQPLLTHEEENSLYDIAACVEGFTKKRALDRLAALGQTASPLALTRSALVG